ncbi:MAG: T9SS type A sorting domain-containing protein, partial [Ignavibacteriaceae bacterium]
DFNAAELPSGVYIYQLSTADFTQIKKMILTK